MQPCLKILRSVQNLDDQDQINLDDIYLGQLIRYSIGNDIGNKLRKISWSINLKSTSR
jgi:hypothetical protein